MYQATLFLLLVKEMFMGSCQQGNIYLLLVKEMLMGWCQQGNIYLHMILISLASTPSWAIPVIPLPQMENLLSSQWHETKFDFVSAFTIEYEIKKISTFIIEGSQVVHI